ncbi:hypothetical protein L226DRAFT_94364 [Lentinus tigrinus ALCF2SS1-7]|uniref:Uncharacterized protein n=1 Tax=Lentinus tigrinus ALCF2SS1-6 TaxID=1328759 RepID=A0A5C2RPP8_9APHY|nr:hypothetical protein L227DRAFT_396691 [Lentinus tigrinus ALCF2SS1-6]RPD73662.1 hypothetical protein L226DRAFT_94364 [Lentinus tigrinus ALCF2SS1-7]
MTSPAALADVLRSGARQRHQFLRHGAPERKPRACPQSPWRLGSWTSASVSNPCRPHSQRLLSPALPLAPAPRRAPLHDTQRAQSVTRGRSALSHPSTTERPGVAEIFSASSGASGTCAQERAVRPRSSNGASWFLESAPSGRGDQRCARPCGAPAGTTYLPRAPSGRLGDVFRTVPPTRSAVICYHRPLSRRSYAYALPRSVFAQCTCPAGHPAAHEL